MLYFQIQITFLKVLSLEIMFYLGNKVKAISLSHVAKGISLRDISRGDSELFLDISLLFFFFSIMTIKKFLVSPHSFNYWA